MCNPIVHDVTDYIQQKQNKVVYDGVVIPLMGQLYYSLNER